MDLDGLRRQDVADSLRASGWAVLVALLSVVALCGLGAWLIFWLAGMVGV